MNDGQASDQDFPARSSLTEWLLGVDAWLEGRRGKVLAALALFEAVLAPMIDRSLVDVGRVRALRDTARAIGHAELGEFEFFSLVGVAALVVFGGLVFAARVTALQAPSSVDEQRASAWASVESARRVASTESRLLWRRSGLERLFLIGLLVFATVRAISSILAFLRFLFWKAIVVPLGMQEGVLGRLLEAVYRLEGVAAIIGLVGLIATTISLVMWALRREGQAEGQAGSVRDLRLLKASHPYLTGEDSRGHAQIASGFHGGLVQELFAALSAWEPSAHARWEYEIRDDLAEFLMERGFDVRVEFNLGREMRYRRIDLVVGGQVAVELKFELGRSSESDRAMGQVLQYAEFWRGRGPVLTLIVFADPQRLRFLVDNVAAWNSKVELPQAPVLVMTRGQARTV